MGQCEDLLALVVEYRAEAEVPDAVAPERQLMQ